MSTSKLRLEKLESSLRPSSYFWTVTDKADVL